MTTRTRRSAVPEREGTPATSESMGREEVLEYLRQLKESMLKEIFSAVLKPERIRAIVEDEYGHRLLRIEESCSALAQSQQGLRKEFEGFADEPCKAELKAIRDELTAMRAQVTGEFRKLWDAINALKGETPRANDTTDEPVTVPDTENPPTHPQEGRGSDTSRSRKSGAKGARPSKRKQKKRAYYESNSDSSSSSEESEDDLSNPDGDEIRVADRDCRKVLNVDTYRLIDRDPERNVALKTTRVLANLRHLYDGEKFDGSDPLTVLPFLEELKITFDDADLCEGDARHMLRYFLTGEAARLFKGLSPREKRSYPQIVKWLLRTYVRESMLQNAREEFLTRAQRPTETELEYSKTLSSLAKRCAGMIPARDLINRFIRGLRPAIRTQVQSRVENNTSWAVAVAIAAEHGNAHREAQKEQDSRRDPAFMPLPRRRHPIGKGKALAIRHPRMDDDSDLDDLGAHEEDPRIFDERDSTVGAIHQGSPLLRRNESYASLPRSSSSSSERYYTPRPSFVRREVREKKLATNSKKVMLPPGIPYPATRTQTTPPASPARTANAVNALPCLGCGQTGHWLSDCPMINPRLKELALDSLRARKQARRVRYDEKRDPSPGRYRSVLPIEEDDENAPAEAEERHVPTEETG